MDIDRTQKRRASSERVASAALACIIAVALVLAGPAPSAVAGSGNTVYLPNITRMLGGPDGWQTPFVVQNVGADATTVTMDFYSFADGSLVKTRSVPSLAPGTSVFHDPNSDTGLPAGGQFSVVITSTSSPIVSVVNEHQNVQNQSRQEALSYDGLSSGSDVVFLPYVAKQADGWLTTIIIQNVGSGPATVTARFVGSAGETTIARTIDPGRSRFIDPAAEAGLVAGNEYGATLTSTQPIAVVVNAHNDAASVPFPRGFSYNGQPATSEEDTFLPYVAKQGDAVGRTSRVFIQNAGTVAAAPTLYLRLHGDQSPATTLKGPSVAPGAVWVMDPLTQPTLLDGDHSLEVVGGKFAVIGAALTSSTAMGFSASSAFAEKVFLPNVTRTLGGPGGWTTPIIVQSMGGPYFTLKWYRFSDGQLVHTQTYQDLIPLQAVRVDPRAIAELSDNTQYSVVVEAAAYGVAVAVLETNAGGGDSTMAYDGFAVPPDVPYGTTACGPSTAPGGTFFHCTFYGLTPGVAPVLTVAPPGGAPFAIPETERVAADGSWSLRTRPTMVGQWSITLDTGGIKSTATLFVTAAPFAVTITKSTYGSVAIQTSSGVACRPSVGLPTGSTVPGFYLELKTADASGNLSWSYAPVSGTKKGQGTLFVACFSGALTRSASMLFTVP